jgi:hypothetical protein
MATPTTIRSAHSIAESQKATITTRKIPVRKIGATETAIKENTAATETTIATIATTIMTTKIKMEMEMEMEMEKEDRNQTHLAPSTMEHTNGKSVSIIDMEITTSLASKIQTNITTIRKSNATLEDTMAPLTSLI